MGTASLQFRLKKLQIESELLMFSDPHTINGFARKIRIGNSTRHIVNILHELRDEGVLKPTYENGHYYVDKTYAFERMCNNRILQNIFSSIKQEKDWKRLAEIIEEKMGVTILKLR